VTASRDGAQPAAVEDVDSRLDDHDTLAALDSQDVLGAVEGFARQCREGWAIGRAASGLPDGADVDSVVVLGMGGSGVSGDVAACVVEPRLAVPFRTIKGYGPLPGWVGRNTIVFAVSYSGSTEETLAALGDATERGARVIAISSGGPLQERAGELGFAHIAIPGGLQPRASLGYLTLPLLAALEKVGLVPSLEADVEEAVALLEELADACRRDAPRARNPAKDLAGRIFGRIPVVYGAQGLAEVAAYRFKCDLNEYGKTPAFSNYLPELDHNEIVGWKELEELTSASFIAVMLRDPEEHPRVALRFEITERLVAGNLAEVVELRARGRSPLARVLSLIFVTQLAAIYVGLLYGVDPGPVEVIQSLKEELAKREG
jgi:glucose/mannose-6-phosphate isomerase